MAFAPTQRTASVNNSSDGNSPFVAALASFNPTLTESFDVDNNGCCLVGGWLDEDDGLPAELAAAAGRGGGVANEVNAGAKISSKNGTASVTGLLLKLSRAFAARGVSGNKHVISNCNNAPQLCPTPTTGNAPYSLAIIGATFSNFVNTSSHVCRWLNDNLYGVATIRNPSSANRSSTYRYVICGAAPTSAPPRTCSKARGGSSPSTSDVEP
mmetsp:Transcript_43647/g.105826  ORF Transcript_43647/g.105826 Transcript_43647/m.105826 type:complete len:212 (+) Transcript_43647:945-1580(+)